MGWAMTYDPDATVLQLYIRLGYHPTFPPGPGLLVRAALGRGATYHSSQVPLGDAWLVTISGQPRVAIQPGMAAEMLAGAYSLAMARWVVKEDGLSISQPMVLDLGRRIHVPSLALMAARLSRVSLSELAPLLVARLPLVEFRWRETFGPSGMHRKP